MRRETRSGDGLVNCENCRGVVYWLSRLWTTTTSRSFADAFYTLKSKMQVQRIVWVGDRVQAGCNNLMLWRSKVDVAEYEVGSRSVEIGCW